MKSSSIRTGEDRGRGSGIIEGSPIFEKSILFIAVSPPLIEVRTIEYELLVEVTPKLSEADPLPAFENNPTVEG